MSVFSWMVFEKSKLGLYFQIKRSYWDRSSLLPVIGSYQTSLVKHNT